MKRNSLCRFLYAHKLRESGRKYSLYTFFFVIICYVRRIRKLAVKFYNHFTKQNDPCFVFKYNYLTFLAVKLKVRSASVNYTMACSIKRTRELSTRIRKQFTLRLTMIQLFYFIFYKFFFFVFSQFS